MSKVGLDDLVVAGASAEDLTGLPRVDWWPTLAPEALYGLAGRIVETVAPYTEADPVAVLAHLLVGVGNLIGSGPHALVGSERHPLRLYAALVGQSSKARKGTAWGMPRYILKRMAREGNSLSGVIRDAWDTGNLSTLTKNSPLRATGAHLSLGGHLKAGQLWTGQTRPVGERPKHACSTPLARQNASPRAATAGEKGRPGGCREMACGEIMAPGGSTALAVVWSTPHDGFRSPPWSRVRQLRGPHVRTWAWWRSRSSSAVTAAVSPRSFPQSSTGRFEVIRVDVLS